MSLSLLSLQLFFFLFVEHRLYNGLGTLINCWLLLLFLLVYLFVWSSICLREFLLCQLILLFACLELSL